MLNAVENLKADIAKRFADGEMKVARAWTTKAGLNSFVNLEANSIMIKNGEDVFPSVTLWGTNNANKKLRVAIGCRRKTQANYFTLPNGNFLCENVEQVVKDIATSFNKLRKISNALCEIEFNDTLFKAFLNCRFPNDTTQADNGKKAVIRNYLKDVEELQQVNAWIVLNSYVKYTTQERRVHLVKDDIESKESVRLQAIFFGKTAQDNAAAFDDIVSLTQSKSTFNEIFSQVEA